MAQLRENSILEERIFVSRLPESAGSSLILAPAIDVFFLLLSFIVLGSGMVYSQGIKIHPPTVDGGEYESVDKLVIMMRQPQTESGSQAPPVQLFFNNMQMQNYSQLENQLKRIVGRSTKRAESSGRRVVVILRADNDVRLQDIAEVMTICRRNNLRLFIPTKSKSNATD